MTYRWNDEGTDATLLTTADTRPLRITTSSGPREQTWTFPSRANCDGCHNATAGYVLGFNAWQLNRQVEYPNGSRDNQLERLRAVGAFINPYPEGEHEVMQRAVHVNDAHAPVEARLKS